jgi:hypothetical protein
MSFLPGWFPAAAMTFAEEVLDTLTQVGLGTSTALNGVITSSVTIQAGDLLVVWGHAESNPVAPPGFTLAASAAGPSPLDALYYKIATGTEGTSVTGVSGGNVARKRRCYRPPFVQPCEGWRNQSGYDPISRLQNL